MSFHEIYFYFHDPLVQVDFSDLSFHIKKRAGYNHHLVVLVKGNL